MSEQLSLPIVPGEWRPILGEEPYEVSAFGKVRRSGAKMNRQSLSQIKPVMRANGYPSVCLYSNGARRDVEVHTLVAGAFLGPRPKGQEVNHKDGNKQNNVATNLEYLTHRDNQRHALATGLAKMPPGRVGLLTCPRGHPYEYVKPNGMRVCRTCKNLLSRGEAKPMDWAV